MNKLLPRLFLACSWVSVLGTLAAVFSLLAFLGLRGFHTLGAGLFWGGPPSWAILIGRLPVWEGIWPACVGTCCLILLSSAAAIPLGVASGIYLAQYATAGWKRWFTMAVDLLAGMPSIMMGLLGFALILLLRKTLIPGANTGLLLSAGCLALLVLPYLIVMTRNALEVLPESLKLAGLSLGFTPWQNIRHVLLPAAGRGILSGIILAVGRAAEDTAVILLTGVVANAGLPRSLTDKFEALPFTIYYLAAEHRTPGELDRGFGAALVLLLLTGALFLGAHWLQRTMAKRWDWRNGTH